MGRKNSWNDTLIDFVEGEIDDAMLGIVQGGGLILGGDEGPYGGTGGPWRTPQGQLPQSLVCYDTTEAATMLTSGHFLMSGHSSLVDNLNHIRWHHKPATWFEVTVTTPRAMRVHVASGIWHYNGVQYLDFEGGDSPTITSPMRHSRYDVVYITASGEIGIQQGQEAEIPSVVMPPECMGSGNPIMPLAIVYLMSGAYAVGWPRERMSYSGYIWKDIRPFVTFNPCGSGITCSCVGSGGMSAGAWLEALDGGMTLAFSPDRPALFNPTTNTLTEYDTIQTAIDYAGAGYVVLIPPGTYDENIVLVSDVPVVEIYKGTVDIFCTGGQVAVTIPSSPGDYYINVRSISIEASLNSGAASTGLTAVVCNHTSGTATIIADLYCHNTYTSGDATAIGIRNTSTGKIVYRGQDAEWNIDVQSDGNDWGAYGVRGESTGDIYGEGSIRIQCPNTGCWGYCLQNRNAATWVWNGDFYLNCATDSDVIHTRAGGSLTYHGDITAHSDDHIRGILARDGACEIYICGRMVLTTDNSYAIGLSNTSAGRTSTSNIVYEGNIEVSTANGSARGVDVVGGTCTGTITLLDVDIQSSGTGDSYGVNNEVSGATIKVIGGKIETTSSAGNPYDLRQTAGTLQVFNVQYDTANGTITFLDGNALESLNDYARGSIIRGGASDWEAYAAKADGQILVGDGTDINSVPVSQDVSLDNTGAATVIGIQGRAVGAGAPADGQTYIWNDTASEWQPGAVPASQVEVAEIDTATYDDVQDWLNNVQSAGYISGGTLSAHSDPITAANVGGAGAGSFEVAGDQTAGYEAGDTITVSGSTGNDGDYTVSAGGSSYAGGVTTIPVDEAVTDGTADGNIANGRIDISALTGFLKTTDSEIGETRSFDLAGTTNFAITDAMTNYVFVNYVGGPKFDVTTTRSDIELNRQFPLGQVYRDGTTLRIIQSGIQLPNFQREEHERIMAVRGFERASGGTISEKGNRYLESTAGVFYLGRNRITTTGVDTSGAATFTRHYHSGGVWASDTQSQICATAYQYDNGTDLANIANNRYGVFWVYINYDSDLHVVVGRGSYRLAEAQAVMPPETPPIVSGFSILAAKIIIKQGATNFHAVAGAYDVAFPLVGAIDHNDTGAIQGGAADDYYHVTGAQHTTLSAMAEALTMDGGDVLPVAASGQALGDATHRWDVYAGEINTNILIEDGRDLFRYSFMMGR